MDRLQLPSVDAARDSFHSNWIGTADLEDSLTAQSYRPEIVAAMREVQARGSCELGHIASSIRQGRTPAYAEAGVVCLKTKHVESVLVRPANEAFVTDSFAAQNDHLRVGVETVLITRSGAGSIGRAGIYLRDDQPLTNEHLVHVYIAAPHDAAYIAAFLSSWWGERGLERGITGSTGQLQLNQNRIASVPICTPDPAIQRAIGNKVRKADRLRKLAAAGSGAAQARMDQGTVTFEAAPSQYGWITARALTERLDTQPYRSHVLSLHDALQRASANRLAQLATVTGGDPVSSDEFAPDGVPLVRIRDIQPGGFAAPGMCVSPDYFRSRPAYAARPLRIVLGMDGEFRAQFFIESDLPRFVNQRVAIIDCERIRPELLTAWLNRPEGQLQLARWTVQTTVAHTSLRHVRNLLIPRLAEDEEKWLADAFLRARKAGAEAAGLVAAARQDVEALIDGTLDEPALLAEGAAIEQWLAANPSPHATEKD